ncbi:substrate-binding domain-containing protein [Actinokineospora auranticolor]|uniref:Ribose transport system substrate-binding protein n=1 Tax=Actinokineospora auranticolor TaxID=155976 RepID=A0A2S6GT87_9PSEU|nr:substrate-binding domain-containing protein [Actinokineospora auranticolor]PPK68387.1 ribose transport system substrate-binding protein [Actinokineospora auranticolor]
MALPARPRAKQVFLLLSAYEQKYWLHSLIGHLADELDRANLDVVLKVPDRDYDSRTLVRHMRGLLQRREDFVGGFLMVTEVDRVRRELADFCPSVRVPVVFLDVEPFAREAEYPPGTGFVGYRAGDIGAVAGDWLAGWFRRAGTREPVVQVLASREHADRQRRFAEVLREALPGARVAIDDTCAFDRVRAMDAIHDLLHDRPPGHAARPDALFCTNDEMALGAADALRGNGAAIPILGVDGLADVLTALDRGDSPLRATVVQDTRALAANATDLLHRMHTEDPSPRLCFLEPRIHTGRGPAVRHAPGAIDMSVHNELHTTAPSTTLGSAHNVWITNQAPGELS